MVSNCQVFVHTCFSDSFLVPLRFTDPFLTASSFHSVGFSGDSVVKNLPANACQCRRHKRNGFHLWVRRSPGGGNGNPLQYSCLEYLMDREAWQVTKSRTYLRHDWAHFLYTSPKSVPPLTYGWSWYILCFSVNSSSAHIQLQTWGAALLFLCHLLN